MEDNKGKAKPLSREERDAKKIKINVEDLQNHLELMHTNIVGKSVKMADIKNLKK